MMSTEQQITPPNTPAPAFPNCNRLDVLQYYYANLQNWNNSAQNCPQPIKPEPTTGAGATPAQLAHTFLTYHIMAHSNNAENSYLQNTNYHERPSVLTNEEYTKLPENSQKLQMNLFHNHAQYHAAQVQVLQVPSQVENHEISPVSGESSSVTSGEELWQMNYNLQNHETHGHDNHENHGQQQ